MEQGAVSPLMQDKQSPVLIQVYMADDDGAVREELLARQIDQDTYELLSSPGLAQNLARGDIVSIKDRNAPAVVLKRGGNFCIQIYADYISPEAITALEHAVVRELNGTLDGICEGSLSLAVPAKNGMERINGFLTGSVSKRRFSGITRTSIKISTTTVTKRCCTGGCYPPKHRLTQRRSRSLKRSIGVILQR